MFDVQSYIRKLGQASWQSTPDKVKKSDRPVTLADYEAAEREARKAITYRLDNPPVSSADLSPIETMIELEDDGGSEAYDICDYGIDLIGEVRAWQKCAADLLAFKNKRTKKKAA